MNYDSILSDFLIQLNVPHTRTYCCNEFRQMPFQSLFGLGKLLECYGVDSQGVMVENKQIFSEMPLPFLAGVSGGYVIVSDFDGKNVTYISEGETESIPYDEFIEAWTGVAMLAYPRPDASEPDFCSHRLTEMAEKAKNYVMWTGACLLFLYLFIANGYYARLWSWGVILVDLAALVFSYMLLQKTLKIKNKVADKVCGVLQEGGCDHVLELKAAKFFGLFSWSEVGFTYFSVNLLAFLMFPDSAPSLAACNLLCLPFTFWSVWYQKFRAKHWCTLCVSVQASLWLLFLSYWGGGWLAKAWPVGMDFWLLGITYVTVLMCINRLSSKFQSQSSL